jgi:hypothetical protein
MRKSWTATAMALALVACQKAPEENTAVVATANPYAERLKSMSAPYRDLAMRNAVRDSGQHCQRVETSRYQEDYKNMSMWTARCSDTGDWAIFIAPGGDAQVRPCADAKSLGIPECVAVTAKP